MFKFSPMEQSKSRIEACCTRSCTVVTKKNELPLSQPTHLLSVHVAVCLCLVVHPDSFQNVLPPSVTVSACLRCLSHVQDFQRHPMEKERRFRDHTARDLWLDLLKRLGLWTKSKLKSEILYSTDPIFTSFF